jgi:hypothetical protein
MSLIRAFIAWFVVFWLLLLLTSMLGLISVYEVVLVLIVSVVLTAFLLRVWDRRHPSDVGSTPSS